MKVYNFLIQSENVCTIAMVSAESLPGAYCDISRWVNTNPFNGINYNSIELIEDERKPLIVIDPQILKGYRNKQ